MGAGLTLPDLSQTWTSYRDAVQYKQKDRHAVFRVHDGHTTMWVSELAEFHSAHQRLRARGKESLSAAAVKEVFLAADTCLTDLGAHQRSNVSS
jgi:hypothetical protein